jgi:hypothetical protein
MLRWDGSCTPVPSGNWGDSTTVGPTLIDFDFPETKTCLDNIKMVMNTKEEFTVYECPVRFDENRIRAAAVYCSDGRFGEQVDDFLNNALKLPRYDRLAVPGGAACLAGHLFAYREEWALIEQVQFLIRAHGLERLVLIAHQDCAFYAQQMRISAEPLETRQREDLQTAAQRIRSFAPSLLVDIFFARKQLDGTIRFESLA